MVTNYVRILNLRSRARPQTYLTLSDLSPKKHDKLRNLFLTYLYVINKLIPTWTW